MEADFNLEDRIQAAINAAYTRFKDCHVVADDAQIVDGEWLAPDWGCDTMQHFIDALRDCDA